MLDSFRFKRLIAITIIVILLWPAFSWTFESFPARPWEPAQQLAKILDHYHGRQGMVYVITDLHCDYYAQQTIAKLIDQLHRHRGLSLIGVEGDSERIQLGKLRTFPIGPAKPLIADYYMRQGKLSGAEYTASLTDQLILHGMEDQTCYQESYQLVQACLRFEYLGYVHDLKNLLLAAADKLNSPPDQAKINHFLTLTDQLEHLLSFSATNQMLQNFKQHAFSDWYAALQAIARKSQQSHRLLAMSEFHKLELAINNIQRFYTLVDQRSHHFVGKLEQAMIDYDQQQAILITGGFHLDKILADLRAKGISYLALEPQPKLRDQQNRYYDILLNRSQSFERQLSGLLHQPRQLSIKPATFLPTGLNQIQQQASQHKRKKVFELELGLMLKALGFMLWLGSSPLQASSLENFNDQMKNYYGWNNSRIELDVDRFVQLSSLLPKDPKQTIVFPMLVDQNPLIIQAHATWASRRSFLSTAPAFSAQFSSEAQLDFSFQPLTKNILSLSQRSTSNVTSAVASWLSFIQASISDRLMSAQVFWQFTITYWLIPLISLLSMTTLLHHLDSAQTFLSQIIGWRTMALAWLNQLRLIAVIKFYLKLARFIVYALATNLYQRFHHERDQAPFKAGVVNFIQACHGHVPLFVNTVSNLKKTRTAFARRNIEHFFTDFYRATIKTGLKRAVLVKLLKTLPADGTLVMIGDSQYDMDAVKDLPNCIAIGVEHDQTGALLRAHGARALIQHYDQLNFDPTTHRLILPNGEVIPNVKAIVFDVDGTILDSFNLFIQFAENLFTKIFMIPAGHAWFNQIKAAGQAFYREHNGLPTSAIIKHAYRALIQLNNKIYQFNKPAQSNLILAFIRYFELDQYWKKANKFMSDIQLLGKFIQTHYRADNHFIRYHFNRWRTWLSLNWKMTGQALSHSYSVLVQGYNDLFTALADSRQIPIPVKGIKMVSLPWSFLLLAMVWLSFRVFQPELGRLSLEQVKQFTIGLLTMYVSFRYFFVILLAPFLDLLFLPGITLLLDHVLPLHWAILLGSLLVAMLHGWPTSVNKTNHQELLWFQQPVNQFIYRLVAAYLISGLAIDLAPTIASFLQTSGFIFSWMTTPLAMTFTLAYLFHLLINSLMPDSSQTGLLTAPIPRFFRQHLPPLIKNSLHVAHDIPIGQGGSLPINILYQDLDQHSSLFQKWNKQLNPGQRLLTQQIGLFPPTYIGIIGPDGALLPEFQMELIGSGLAWTEMQSNHFLFVIDDHQHQVRVYRNNLTTPHVKLSRQATDLVAVVSKRLQANNQLQRRRADTLHRLKQHDFFNHHLAAPWAGAEQPMIHLAQVTLNTPHDWLVVHGTIEQPDAEALADDLRDAILAVGYSGSVLINCFPNQTDIIMEHPQPDLLAALNKQAAAFRQDFIESDLHLATKGRSDHFGPAKEALQIELINQIAAQRSTLWLGGDTWELERKKYGEIKRAYPDLFQAWLKVRRIIMTPGNHDHMLYIKVADYEHQRLLHLAQQNRLHPSEHRQDYGKLAHLLEQMAIKEIIGSDQVSLTHGLGARGVLWDNRHYYLDRTLFDKLKNGKSIQTLKRRLIDSKQNLREQVKQDFPNMELKAYHYNGYGLLMEHGHVSDPMHHHHSVLGRFFSTLEHWMEKNIDDTWESQLARLAYHLQRRLIHYFPMKALGNQYIWVLTRQLALASTIRRLHDFYQLPAMPLHLFSGHYHGPVTLANEKVINHFLKMFNAYYHNTRTWSSAGYPALVPLPTLMSRLGLKKNKPKIYPNQPIPRADGNAFWHHVLHNQVRIFNGLTKGHTIKSAASWLTMPAGLLMLYTSLLPQDALAASSLTTGMITQVLLTGLLPLVMLVLSAFVVDVLKNRIIPTKPRRLPRRRFTTMQAA